MSRDSAKAHYTKQPGDPDEGFITASDAQAAIDDIYDDMSAPAVIADGSVTSGKIAADAVGSAQIATGAVGSGELATDAVTSDKIADGAVSNAHVASDAAIAASKVAGTAVTQADTGTVTNGMLAGSIAKTKVAGTAITAADTGTVTGTMIGTGEVGNGNLAANAVNEAKIASGAVTTVKIEDDAVTTAKIAADAVTSAEIAANAVGASELADSAVDTAAIAADAVTADKIANDTITAAELAAGSVGTSELADDSVTAAKILDGTITANEIQNASITGAKLVNDTITAAQIAANAVGASELADNAVDTAAIQDGAATPAKLARQPGNLLSENQASIETDASGWIGYEANLTASTSYAYHGSKSLRLESTVANGGIAYVDTSPGSITPGDTYTVTAQVRTNQPSSETAYVGLQWYTSGGAVIDTAIGKVTALSNSAWTQLMTTATAPANASYVRVLLARNAGVAWAYSYWDAIGLWKGVGGQWSLPGVPVPGQGAIKANGAVELPGGDYSPEGTVTANPGSTFLQTSGAATVTGMLSWRKATGTGNTGWVPEGALADTGWRDVSSLLINGWSCSGGFFRIKRVGSRVSLMTAALKGGATINVQMCDIPAGFRTTPYSVPGAVFRDDVSTGKGGWLQASYSSPNVWGGLNDGTTWTTDHGVSMEASWLTGDSWPASLPGSAA